jgi:hypothetical protein
VALSWKIAMRVAAALVLFLASLAAAFAQGVTLQSNQHYLCYDRSEIVTAVRAGAPPLVNATLTRFPTIAFGLSKDEWGDHYFIRYFIRAPEPVTDGVCSVYLA